MLKKVVIVDYERSVRPKNLFPLTGQNVLFAKKIPVNGFEKSLYSLVLVFLIGLFRSTTGYIFLSVEFSIYVLTF